MADQLIAQFLLSAVQGVQNAVSMFAGRVSGATKDPQQAAQLGMAFVVSHFLFFTTVFVVMMMFKGGRKRLRKYWRLSKQGPFHRLIVWICSKLLQLFVWMTGTRFIGDPSGCSPRFTTIATQVNRIVLHWTSKPSGKWADDTYEVEMERTSGQAGGVKKSSVTVWENIYAGKEQKCDCEDLDEGMMFKFRVRTVNARGHSEWTEGHFATRQRAYLNGGTGPGYTWSQTSNEVQLVIAINSDSKSKGFVVECRGGKLLVQDTSVTPTLDLVNGEIWKPVKGSELSWTLGMDEHSKKQLVLLLEKVEPTNKRKDHWQCVIKGHPLLDSRFLPDCLIPSGKLPQDV